VQSDVLIAYELNGAPLPVEHGFPARLVVPGFYGTNSVKWLTRITVAKTRATGAFTTRWYNDPVPTPTGATSGTTVPVEEWKDGRVEEWSRASVFRRLVCRAF
jgi:DMSO/TMAO reductase YedYZ molybdopterin-dependent catalytic subunit